MQIYYKEVETMTKYREILQLTAPGFSQRSIMQSVGTSQKTVVKVQRRARELNLTWLLPESLTDDALGKQMFPREPVQPCERKMPDLDYIRKELQKNGVNKKLLWTEYLEECRLSGDDPLMYSQFCEYIRRDEQKRRTTMHIDRKPGELHIPAQTGHQFRLKLDNHSGNNWTLVPMMSGRPFRCLLDTDSDVY